MTHELAKIPLEPEDTRGHNPVVRQPRSRTELLKRLLDIVLSLLALVLIAPVMLIIALFIKLISPGPVCFRCVGGVRSDGKPYWFSKFRTIHRGVDCERLGVDDSRPVTPRELRFIPLGRFLRKTRIDEVPMLFDVMRGTATFFASQHRPVRECLTMGTEEPASVPGTEKWLGSLAYWIPRKYREPLVGDIMEDCCELRALGKSEWRIRIHVVWQLVIALIMLRPTAIMDALKRMWSTK